jgi:hypothetical protein
MRYDLAWPRQLAASDRGSREVHQFGFQAVRLSDEYIIGSSCYSATYPDTNVLQRDGMRLLDSDTASVSYQTFIRLRSTE